MCKNPSDFRCVKIFDFECVKNLRFLKLKPAVSNMFFTGLLEGGLSQQNAIENAKKLFIDQQDKPCHEQNPVTTVYQLVSILNQCSRCSQMSFEGEV